MADENKMAQEPVRFQTFSNRDYVNKNYVDLYTRCVTELVASIAKRHGILRSTGKEFLEPEMNFKLTLTELYWNIVIPRISLIRKEIREYERAEKEKAKEEKKEGRDYFPLPDYKNALLDNEGMLLSLEEMPMEKTIKILAACGRFLFDFGVLRTESKLPNLKDILIKKLEVSKLGNL